MNNRIGVVLLAVLLAMVAAQVVVAQPPEHEEPGAREPDRWSEGPDAVRELERFAEQVVDELELDEELADEVWSLFDERLEKMRDQSEGSSDSRRDNARAVRELVHALRDAQQEGDRERASQIREQLAELRRQRSMGGEDYTELFDSVRGLLDEQQRGRFDQLAAAFLERTARGRDLNRPGGQLRQMHRAIAMLDLSDEQREQTRRILVDAMREQRHAGDDPGKLKELEESVKKDIIEQLDDEQAQEFERRLVELQERAKKGERVQPAEPVTPPPTGVPEGGSNTGGPDQGAGEEPDDDQPDDSEG